MVGLDFHRSPVVFLRSFSCSLGRMGLGGCIVSGISPVAAVIFPGFFRAKWMDRSCGWPWGEDG